MASVEVPTTTEVTDLIVAHVEQSIGQTIPLLPKAFTRVLAKALSGVFVLVYKYAAFIFLQMFVEHASWRETVVNGRTIRPLVELGKQLGVGEPLPDVRCEAIATATVTNQVGELAAGSQLVKTSTGVIYTVVAAVDLTIGPAVELVARASLEGAGTVGHLEAGDVLSFVNPLPNISRDVTVTAVTVSGTDGETESEYRARVRRRRQTPPQGGAYADYRLWGEELADIAAIYPYTASTPGEIDIYVEAVSTAANPDGVPTSTQLDNVEAAIQSSSQSTSGLPNRRPVLAAINTLAITRSAFTVEVTGLSVSDEEGAQSAIEDALDAFFRERKPYILGLTPLPRTDRFSAADVAGIVSSTAAAYGGSVTSVALLESGIEIQSRALATGELARLASGGVTYV